MKTVSKSHNIISQQTIVALVAKIFQASSMLQRYSYWFLSIVTAFTFFSCQRNLIQTTSLPIIAVQKVETPVETVITIDTTNHSVFNHLSPCHSDTNTCKRILEKVVNFYEGNSLETKWLKANSPSPLFLEFLDQLKKAEHFGLNPETYKSDYIEELVQMLYQNQSVNPNDIISADIKITEVFFLFALHLREGRITNLGSGDKIWIMSKDEDDDSDVSMLVLTQSIHDLDLTIRQLQPASEQYVNLQKMLVAYRGLAKSESKQSLLSVQSVIKPGTKNGAIPVIRKRLATINLITDNTLDVSDSLYYDSTLEESVKMFQQRHGLNAEGIIGEKTIMWLNMSFKERADLIALNMERIRWTPAVPGPQRILVNIPEYKLRIYEEDQQTLDMNVIVGAVENATPIFHTTLESIVFSPTWTVPARIIKDEFVPRLVNDKMYYAERKNFTFYKKGVEIDPSTERWDSAFNVKNYKIVQKSGTDNALGLVKFIIPNNMNIYLHDTPDHKPFSHQYRALSHGCIRLDDPAKLANYLLQGDAKWDSKRIKKAMTSGQPQKTNLNKQYKVHLEYNTVWVDENGNLNFREDIYGHDERQLKSLYPVSIQSGIVASASH